MLSELFFSEFLCTWKSYSHNVASAQPSLAAGDIWSVAFVKLRGISAAMKYFEKAAEWIRETLVAKSGALEEDEADDVGDEPPPPPPPYPSYDESQADHGGLVDDLELMPLRRRRGLRRRQRECRRWIHRCQHRYSFLTVYLRRRRASICNCQGRRCWICHRLRRWRGKSHLVLALLP